MGVRGRDCPACAEMARLSGGLRRPSVGISRRLYLCGADGGRSGCLSEGARVTRLDAACGCSLGGACLTRLLALGEVPVGRAIIDGGIMPCRFAYPLRRLVLLRDVLGFKIAAGSRRMLEAAFPPEHFTLPEHDPREEYGAMEAYLRTCSGRTIRNVFWSGNNYRLCGQQCAREGDGTRNPTRCTLPSVFPPAPRRRESARFSESEESSRCPDIDATSGRCFLAEFWKCRLSNLGQL